MIAYEVCSRRDQLGKTRRNRRTSCGDTTVTSAANRQTLQVESSKGQFTSLGLSDGLVFDRGSDLFLIDGSVGPLELEVRKEGLFV